MGRTGGPRPAGYRRLAGARRTSAPQPLRPVGWEGPAGQGLPDIDAGRGPEDLRRTSRCGLGRERLDQVLRSRCPAAVRVGCGLVEAIALGPREGSVIAATAG